MRDPKARRGDLIVSTVVFNKQPQSFPDCKSSSFKTCAGITSPLILLNQSFAKSRQKNVDMRTKRFIKAEKKQPGDTRRTRTRTGLNNKEEDRNRKWKQEQRNETGRLVSVPLCCRNKQSKSSNCFCLFHEYKPCAELQLAPPGLQIQELLDLKYFPAAITGSQRREKHMSGRLFGDGFDLLGPVRVSHQPAVQSFSFP